MAKSNHVRSKAKRKTKVTKTEQLRALLAKATGITVARLSQKLGWQPHSTRAALTRLRQAGIDLEKLPPVKGNRHARYRIGKSPV